MTVLWTSRMPEGASTCIGNAPVPHGSAWTGRSVTGELLDGSSVAGPSRRPAPLTATATARAGPGSRPPVPGART